MLNHRLKSLTASLLFAALMLLPGFGYAQAPVPVQMTSQSGLSYTENFADIANWANSIAAGNSYLTGTGATRWGSVVQTTATGIPSATSTTQATTTFTTSGSSAGVQRGSLSGNVPGTLVLLTTGATP
ncbi:MAG: hypothetical protein EBZ58_07430, partial [Bacteroidetes bacterium]|nr:hypothetical protein [Bacteroidota bacterium]